MWNFSDSVKFKIPNIESVHESTKDFRPYHIKMNFLSRTMVESWKLTISDGAKFELMHIETIWEKLPSSGLSFKWERTGMVPKLYKIRIANSISPDGKIIEQTRVGNDMEIKKLKTPLLAQSQTDGLKSILFAPRHTEISYKRIQKVSFLWKQITTGLAGGFIYANQKRLDFLFYSTLSAGGLPRDVVNDAVDVATSFWRALMVCSTSQCERSHLSYRRYLLNGQPQSCSRAVCRLPSPNAWKNREVLPYVAFQGRFWRFLRVGWRLIRGRQFFSSVTSNEFVRNQVKRRTKNEPRLLCSVVTVGDG